ncbi:unnamed protein product, partial [Ixodes hexagonus]
LGAAFSLTAYGDLGPASCKAAFGSCVLPESRTETGHRHQCRYCPYSTHKRSQVILHEHTHTGRRPFHCQICGKAFSQRGHLTVHEAIHAGVKRFKCHVCGREFIHKRSFTRHQSTLH